MCFMCQKPYHALCGTSRRFKVYSTKYSESRKSQEFMHLCYSCILQTEDFKLVYENYCEKYALGVISKDQDFLDFSLRNEQGSLEIKFRNVLGA